MVFEDFLNKVQALACQIGAQFTAQIDEKNRYVAVFPDDDITVFGNPIAPSVMVQTGSGRLYRAVL